MEVSKQLVIYYTYTGNTKKSAEAEAKNRNADLVQVLDVKKPGMLKTALFGCFASSGVKSWPIQSINTNLDVYGKIVIMGPVWAKNFAPQVNSIIDLLPKGKEIELIAVSGNSGANFDKTTAKVKKQGNKVVSTKDIKTGMK